MTQADLVTAATAISGAANAIAAATTAVTSLVTSLKGQQIVDQPTLDSVVTSLQSSQASLAASEVALSALVPTTPGA